MIGAFQSVRNFQAVEHRYERLARAADACVVFADFDAVRERAGPPDRGPDRPEDALGNEWAVVIDAPGYAACLLAWETPESQRDDHLPDRERRFEALWTLDPRPSAAPRWSARRSPPARGAELGRAARGGAARPPARLRGARAGAHRADEPDRRLLGLKQRARTSAPMRAVAVKPSCSAAA